MAAAFISFLALQSSIFLLKETLPSKVASKYSRLQQTDEEQGELLNLCLLDVVSSTQIPWRILVTPPYAKTADRHLVPSRVLLFPAVPAPQLKGLSLFSVSPY